MRSRVRFTAAVLLVAFAMAPHASASTTYRPPFTTVIQGGDFGNVRNVQSNEGRITILRAGTGTPSSSQLPGFSCPGIGGFAKFRLSHLVTEPTSTITISFDQATIDSYAWIITSATEGQNWWGGVQRRGPIANAGTIVVPLLSPGPEIGKTLTMDFGLQVSSACPNVDGGTIRFTEVVVD